MCPPIRAWRSSSAVGAREDQRHSVCGLDTRHANESPLRGQVGEWYEATPSSLQFRLSDNSINLYIIVITSSVIGRNHLGYFRLMFLPGCLKASALIGGRLLTSMRGVTDEPFLRIELNSC